MLKCHVLTTLLPLTVLMKFSVDTDLSECGCLKTTWSGLVYTVQQIVECGAQSGPPVWRVEWQASSYVRSDLGGCGEMQALAPSLGGEIWRPVGCSRPGVAASSCWVYDPAIWSDGFLRCVVLQGCALPVALSGVELACGPHRVALTEATSVLLPAQLMLGASLQERGSGLRTTGVGLYAVTWSLCLATKSRRPVVVVIDRCDPRSRVSEVDHADSTLYDARVSEVDLADSTLYDPALIERDETELLPVFFAAGNRPDGETIDVEEGPWLCARGASRWSEPNDRRSGQLRKKRKWQSRGGTTPMLPDTVGTRQAARAYVPSPNIEIPAEFEDGSDGRFFLPIIGGEAGSWAVVDVGMVTALEAMGELSVAEYNARLRAGAHNVVQYRELGKIKELESGLTLSTEGSGIVACWTSRTVNTQVHKAALNGRSFWDLWDLFERLSIGHTRVEVPSTGV